MSRLEKFLTNRNLLEKFEYNVKHHSTDGLCYRGMKELLNLNRNVNYYFIWKRTEEGYEFWEKVCYEFEKCLENDTL